MGALARGLALAALVGSVACVNDVGDAGEAGAAGPAGDQGAPGPAGPQGTVGGSGIHNQRVAPQAASFDIQGSAVIEGSTFFVGGDGDADADGQVTTADREMITDYFAFAKANVEPLVLTSTQQQHADVDGDGLVTALDREWIDRLIALEPLADVRRDGRRLISRSVDGLVGGSGDVDGDGGVDDDDAALVASWLDGGGTLTGAQRLRADTNGDRRINRIDLETIERRADGMAVDLAAARRAADLALDVNRDGFPILGKRISSAPPAADCNAQAIGAIALDTTGAKLYVCVDAGWKGKALVP